MGRGQFFVIEGIDGSGKETQHKLLLARLEKEGFKVRPVDFPNYDEFFGKVIGQMLNGEFGPMENIHPKLASTMYALDRWSKSPYIREGLENGEIVVANRYELSNKGHQVPRVPPEQRDELFAWLDELEYGKFQIPKPDCTIFLDLPVEISQERIKEKAQRKYLNEENKDFLERDIQNQLEALNIYRSLVERSPNVVRINCVNENNGQLTREVVHELVWNEVSRLVNPNLREGQISRERQI